MKILLLIRALTTGGAERQVSVLARGLHRAGHQVSILVFYGGGELQPEVEAYGIPVIDLGKRGRWSNLTFLGRLVMAVRRENPDVIYSWLSVSNILAALLRPAFPRTRIVWAVCAAFMDLKRYDWLVRLTARLEAWLAPFAHRIISNSHAGRDYAIETGFPGSRISVVPNGTDTDLFRPDRTAGQETRAGWGIGSKVILVGIVGRLDPMKGHGYLLEAAAHIGQVRPDIRFVCVGDGPEEYRQYLHGEARRLGLGDHLVWAGNRMDMPAVYHAMDIAVSSSIGEGLPNTLCEAMACGVPCVVTDVGDSAWVVGNTGVVVPPRSAEALAQGILQMIQRIEHESPALWHAARQRILDELSVESLVRKTLLEIGVQP